MGLYVFLLKLDGKQFFQRLLYFVGDPFFNFFAQLLFFDEVARNECSETSAPLPYDLMDILHIYVDGNTLHLIL